MASVIAFLHSSDPIVQADPTPSHELTPSFLTKFLSHVAFKPNTYREEPTIAPELKDSVAYGRYIVQGIGCYECHSADFKTLNIDHPEQSPGYLGGGNMLLTHEQKKIHSANITMDKETGIGKWSREQFIGVIKNGERYPMKAWSQLDSSEINCIWAYLKTAPVIANKVDRNLGD